MDVDPRSIIRGGLKLAERAGDEAYFAALCMRSGMVGIDPSHRWAQMLLASRATTIYGGTSEVQLNIIAERLLGLPRDP